MLGRAYSAAVAEGCRGDPALANTNSLLIHANMILNVPRSWSDRDIEIRVAEIEEDERLAELEVDSELVWPMVRRALFFRMLDYYSGRESSAIMPDASLKGVLARQWGVIKRAARNWGELGRSVRFMMGEQDKLPVCLVPSSSKEWQKYPGGQFKHPVWNAVLSHPKRAFDVVFLESEYSGTSRNTGGSRAIPADWLLFPSPDVLLRNGLQARRLAKEMFSIFLPKFLEDGTTELWRSFCLGGQAVRRIIQYLSIKQKALALFDDIQPSCVALRNSHTWSGLIAAAKERGIPVIELQHGFTDRYYVAFHWPSWVWHTSKLLPAPDYVITYGSYWSDELQAGGLWPGAKLCPLGSIPIEEQRELSRRNPRPVSSDMKLLYTVGFTYENEVDFWRVVLQLASRTIPDLKLVIKLHPKSTDEAARLYQRLLDLFPTSVQVYKHGEFPTLDLIQQCTLHCSVISTCHFEAVALGRPTLVIKFQEWEYMRDLIDSGAARTCETPRGLVGWLESAARKDAAWEKWCRDTDLFASRFFANGATKNIVALINEITR